ncbi:CAP domain-containing protein [Paracoccus sediminicola]|uniref:CAP domain-containing protein n=1 Tax=Paracoccus sediminicola TaxID=3017783 RepID=UPI0022F028ED|nr:CAP domain-containing protein [Paracoccus sediminicola]WBU55458.1 CAP domain-containing protein [Paracoccus sediminicola]
MSRPPLYSLIAVTAAATLSVAACAPENAATAGDTENLIEVIPAADPTLPDPAVQAIGPVCAAPNAALVAEMQQQINAERERLGKSPVDFVENLTFAAQAHACDMATMGRPTVVGSNGSSVVHRVRAVEYTACSSAQLIGRSGDAYAQSAAWMNQAPDEEILIHQKFDDAGVGVVQQGGRFWWSVVMADNCS